MHMKLLKIVLFIRFHLFICWVCVCVYILMCVQACGDQRSVLSFILNWSPLDFIFEDGISHCPELISLARLSESQASREFQGSACLLLPSTEIRGVCHNACLFNVGAWNLNLAQNMQFIHL